LDCRMLECFKYPSHVPPFCIFGDRFGGKDCGLCPYNPSVEEVGGLDEFLYEVA
jgi:hypothetical protein